MRRKLNEESYHQLAETLSDPDIRFIAIDGRCSAGKSTLAERLAHDLGADILHMDDFFLRAEQRTPERYAEPGGNVDRERVREVLNSLKSGGDGVFRRFDCDVFELDENTTVVRGDGKVIVEGSYSMHPKLREFYDYSVFLTVSPETQITRIRERNPEKVQVFIDRWIPLEEKYFSALDAENACTVSYITE